MSAYTDLYQQAFEEEFLQKLTTAIVGKVKDIYTGNTPNGLVLTNLADALAAYAGPRTSDFRRFAGEFAFVVLAVNPTLNSASDDADFVTAVNTAWIPFASIAQAKGLITLGVV